MGVACSLIRLRGQRACGWAPGCGGESYTPWTAAAPLAQRRVHLADTACAQCAVGVAERARRVAAGDVEAGRCGDPVARGPGGLPRHDPPHIVGRAPGWMRYRSKRTMPAA